jgi:DNA mismatch repair protein MutS
MGQWQECKKKAKDALLFFRLGDFYEAFFEDAYIISKELDLTLTKRQDAPMCGVPFHASDSYVDRLIAKGYKIAIAEQTQSPKDTKGLLRREIIRIVTPATVVNSSLITDKNNNYFVCIAQCSASFGIAIIDLTTSEFKAIQLEDKKDLKDELYRLQPKELLVTKKFQQFHSDLIDDINTYFPCLINIKEEFDFKTAHDAILNHFHIKTLDSFGLNGMNEAIMACGALFLYLSYDLNIDLSHMKTIQTETLSSYMAIDHNCMRHLEIIDSIEKTNTLLHLLDKTSTPMGGRILREWIKKPLLSVKEITERHNSIEELLNNPTILNELMLYLSKIRDLERLIMKIMSNFASPKDILSLRLSLEIIPFIKQLIDPFTSYLLTQEKENLNTDIKPIVDIIQNAITDNPPFRLSDGDIFKDGYNKDLDELRAINKDSQTWIANYQNQLRIETQIKTIKVGYTKAFGYYIDVSRGQAEKMPITFQRKQTLLNSERFITQELKDFEHKILTAEEQIKSLETQLFIELKNKISQYGPIIKIIARSIGHIDTICSLAKVAREHDYKRPYIDESNLLIIEKGRHPIIETKIYEGKFIANDTHMDIEANQLFLITGPNMAGKSTYIRQVALIVIMAQAGSFVPVEKAHIGIVDKVFSRIGASDDIAKGQSTFMVEMTETANILNNATNKSLIILDEIGRGTSTYDGISIAWAVAEYLLTIKEKKAKTLFATHYWELTALEQKIKGAINYNVAVEETSSGIVFLRKIIRGGTDKSYGIHVARLAGLPYTVLKKAEEMLKLLEKKQQRTSLAATPIASSPQMSIFDIKENPIKKELINLDLNQLTPIEALQILLNWQKKVQNNEF